MPPKGWVQHQPPRQQLPCHHQLTDCMAGVGWPASRTHRKLHACPADTNVCACVACCHAPSNHQVDMCCTVLSPSCLQVAEMVQHLELCPILGVACSAYAQKPHLLQVSRRQALHGSSISPAALLPVLTCCLPTNTFCLHTLACTVAMLCHAMLPSRLPSDNPLCWLLTLCWHVAPLAVFCALHLCWWAGDACSRVPAGPPQAWRGCAQLSGAGGTRAQQQGEYQGGSVRGLLCCCCCCCSSAAVVAVMVAGVRGLVMGMFGCCAAHVVLPAVACP